MPISAMMNTLTRFPSHHARRIAANRLGFDELDR
jgi:hypothetical protein